jgi:peptide/nickel transport system permease protein
VSIVTEIRLRRRGAGPASRARPHLWRRVIGDKVVLLSLLFLSVIMTATIIASLRSVDASTAQIAHRLLPPSSSHPLGTDGLGRDVLARMIVGARISLQVGLCVVVIAGTFGTAVGVLAGYSGGMWDALVMRMVEIQFAFPNLLLLVAVIYFFSASVPVLIAAMSVVSWMVFATVVRTTVLSVRTTLYVRAAQLAGCSSATIVRRHILPAVAPVLLTQAMLEFAAVVLAESSLSFLGLGVQPPDASWGLMIAENRPYLERGWWSVLFPGLAIVLTVLSANLIGSALRVWLDPRQDSDRQPDVDSSAD